MATTFSVIRLGKLPDMDTKEGDYNAENAAKLEGLTFGGKEDALHNYVQKLSPGKEGFEQGNTRAYDQNGKTEETFRINDGPDQTFDSVAVFEATLTYEDGSCANISAVIMQDLDGNTYLVPEMNNNSDALAMEKMPIQALTLDRVLVDSNIGGMTADRHETDFVTCYCHGTEISTPDGARRVEDLQVADLVDTQDRGPQPIRWIGHSTVLGMGNMAPIKIDKDALAPGMPARDLWVSQQHRMVLRSPLVRQVFGIAEVMIPAKKLLGLPGFNLDGRPRLVTYAHLLLPRHEVIFANATPSESLYLGPMLHKAVGRAAMRELETLFANMPVPQSMAPARFLPRGRSRKRFLHKLGQFPHSALVYPRQLPKHRAPIPRVGIWEKVAMLHRT